MSPIPALTFPERLARHHGLAPSIPDPDPASPLRRRGEDSPPLLQAVREGRLDVVKRLWASSDTDAINAQGHTVLSLAAYRPQVDMLDLVLDLLTPEQVRRQARSPVQSARSGSTALMLVAIFGNLDALDRLLPWSDATQRNNQGDTALMLAVSFDRLKCVDRLIDPRTVLITNLDGQRPAGVFEERCRARAFNDEPLQWSVLDRLAVLYPDDDWAEATLTRHGHDRLPQLRVRCETRQLRAAIEDDRGPHVPRIPLPTLARNRL